MFPKLKQALIQFALSIFLAAPLFGGQIGSVTLVDGTRMDAELLFKHPNAPRLVLRSIKGSTLQSLPLSLVQKVEANGQTKTHNPPRALQAEEKKELEANGLWGDEVSPKQIGRYATQNWKKKAAMIWAHPGESGDAFDGANWLDETGKAYAANPWIMLTDKNDKLGRKQADTGSFDGDILLPGAESKYRALQSGNRDELGEYNLRHLTVEEGGDYLVRYRILGNLWLKQGSHVGTNTQTGGLGSGDENNWHTFARFCNPIQKPEGLPEGDALWPHAEDISHWVHIDTGKNGSLEVIGLCGGASDRISLANGTLVISEDSYLGNGPRGAFFVGPKGTLILLDGATVGCADRIKGGSSGKSISTYGIAGTILFGTPEHPLKRDLPFGACLYPKDQITPNATASDRASGASFVLAKTGKMVVHSAAPQTARVLFQPRDKNVPVGQYVLSKELSKFTRSVKNHTFSPAPELWQAEGITKGVSAVFLGETDFSGVHFDGFYEGSIIVAPDARLRWKNVTFGKNNLGTPATLFSAP